MTSRLLIKRTPPSGALKYSADFVDIFIGQTTRVIGRQSTVKAIVLVLSDLHSRWARKPFCSSKVWEIEETSGYGIKSELREGTPLAGSIR
jgi:hypothetical protein